MRTPVIAGNWKLYKTADQAVELVRGLIPLVSQTKDVEIVVAPVFTVLSKVADALAGTNVHLAAQDCYWEEEGAYTGEVSSTMLVDAGCSHVIIGHSERRQFFGETDATVNKKVAAAIRANLTVLFCIGETLQERETDQTFKVLQRQIIEGLKNLPGDQLKKVIVAYEPVWAIGTGKTATDSQAQEAHHFIRKVLADLYGNSAADACRILYGGSVKPDNISGLMAQPDIDGALVGGASLKADSFAAIVNFGK